MSIEGLRRPEQAHVPPVNITDEVGVATQITVDYFGLSPDRDAVHEQMKDEFAAADKAGVSGGDKVLAFPRSLVTQEEAVALLDSTEYPGGREYTPTYVDKEVWVPGTHSNGLKAEDIGNLERGQTNDLWLPHVRVIVPNPDSDYDSKLHFLNMQFDNDERYAERNPRELTDRERSMIDLAEDEAEPVTQLDAIAKTKQKYEADHPGFNMNPVNSQGFSYLALRNRIMGIDMPLKQGFMRDATLPRVELGGGGWVGYVRSDEARAGFLGSCGHARPDGGVGLWVGPNEKPQS